MGIMHFNEAGTPDWTTSKKFKLFFLIGSLVGIIAIGSTLAANINLNNSAPVEFGQGVAQTTACDSQIFVTPISSYQNDEEDGFKFSGLTLSNVDTTDQSNTSEGCAGKMFTIKSYDGSGTLLSPSYTIAVQVNGDFISEDGEASTSIGDNSDDSSTLTFTSPSISAEDVYQITIESSEIQPCYGNSNTEDGLTAERAADSGYCLAQNFPSYTSGWYWIKSASMPNALEMYVDMTEDGGGYDFYFVTAGPSVSYVTDTNGGTALGLDLVMPRSKYHWRAMENAVQNESPSGSFYDYFATSYGIYRNTDAFGTSFTSHSMNSRNSVAGKAWRVKDGGRWWLRDSTYSEPNGDYYWNGLLGGGMQPGWDPENDEFDFNDQGAYSTGNYYLVSTNAKP